MDCEKSKFFKGKLVNSHIRFGSDRFNVYWIQSDRRTIRKTDSKVHI